MLGSDLLSCLQREVIPVPEEHYPKLVGTAHWAVLDLTVLPWKRALPKPPRIRDKADFNSLEATKEPLAMTNLWKRTPLRNWKVLSRAPVTLDGLIRNGTAANASFST